VKKTPLKPRIILTVCIIILTALQSCENGMSDLFNSYNGNFINNELIKSDIPGNAGFDQSQMLPLAYSTPYNSTIAIPAPPGCESYLWTIYSSDELELEQFNSYTMSLYNRVVMKNATGNTPCLNLYIPATALTTRNYRLELKCTYISDGKPIEYVDNCNLLIFVPLEGTW